MDLYKIYKYNNKFNAGSYNMFIMGTSFKISYSCQFDFVKGIRNSRETRAPLLMKENIFVLNISDLKKKIYLNPGHSLNPE